jgi:hypothetical protein
MRFPSHPLGICLPPPAHFFICIAARSSLAHNFGIQVDGGVIDANYTGEIGMLLFNTTKNTVLIQHGDRIGQLIFEAYGTPRIQELNYLPATQRSSGGCGSTGGFSGFYTSILQNYTNPYTSFHSQNTHHPTSDKTLDKTSPLTSFNSILTFFIPRRTHSMDIDEDIEDDIEDDDDDSVSNYDFATAYNGSVKNSLYGTARTSLQQATACETKTTAKLQAATTVDSPNSPQPSQQLDALPDS